MTTLEQLSADPDASATVDEMRDFHRTAGPESLLAFQYALHALARPISEYNVVYPYGIDTEWMEDRHEGCRSCSCPTKSVRQCGNVHCDHWIVSVNQEPPAYCSKRCATRAAQERTREFDERVLEIVRNYPDGIEVDLIARHLGVEQRRVSGAIGRFAKRKQPPVKEWRERLPGAGWATAWYVVPVYDSEGARP